MIDDCLPTNASVLPVLQADSSVTAAGETGVVVLSPVLHILHIDRRAADIARRLARQESVNAPHPSGLPPSLVAVCLEVLSALERQARTGAGAEMPAVSWASATLPIQARGFGVRRSNGIGSSRIILVLQERLNRQPQEHAARFAQPVP